MGLRYLSDRLAIKAPKCEPAKMHMRVIAFIARFLDVLGLFWCPTKRSCWCEVRLKLEKEYRIATENRILHATDTLN